eukprot:11530-Amphidinium_carterae.2
MSLGLRPPSHLARSHIIGRILIIEEHTKHLSGREELTRGGSKSAMGRTSPISRDRIKHMGCAQAESRAHTDSVAHRERLCRNTHCAQCRGNNAHRAESAHKRKGPPVPETLMRLF